MRHLTVHVIAALALLCLLRGQLLAVDWTGGGGDLDWLNPSNWTSLPTAGDDVVINHASANGQTIFNFDQASFANITIGAAAGNLMGNGLNLEFNANSSSGFGFGAAGGELRVKSGTGAVALSVAGGGADFGLNDSNIFIESGVTGNFQFLTGGSRRRIDDYPGDTIITSTFTNNSNQDFVFNLRDNKDDKNVQFTLHSAIDGTPGTFDFARAVTDQPRILTLDLTGDARVNLSQNVNAGNLTAAATAEITSSAARTLVFVPGDTVVDGQLTGDLSLAMNTGNEAALTLTNNDTYSGITRIGDGGSSNANRSGALIREGTHIGGGDYSLIGGLRGGGRKNDTVLGGSGVITLQDGATMLLDRDSSDPDAFLARSTVAPGNTGFDASGVNATTGVVGMLSVGNQAVGTLTVTADEVIFGDYGRLEVQIDGPTSDQLAILAGIGGNTNAGNLNLTSSLDELFIDADLLGDANGDVYDILTWEGTRTGEFDQVWLQDGGTLIELISTIGLEGFLIDGFEYDLVYGDNALQLIGPNAATNNEVPEPASVAMWALLGLSLAACAIWRQRRRQVERFPRP